MVYDSVDDWLTAFRADPETLLTRLFNGADQIFPYFRDADGAQLIWYILPRKSDPDPHGDIHRVDRALLALLQTCVQQQASPDNWNIGANRAAQIIDLLSVMHLPVTAQWVRDENSGDRWRACGQSPCGAEVGCKGAICPRKAREYRI